MAGVGWFQELWVLRHLDGVRSLLSGSDRIYDSFNVSYTLRWDHEYPCRQATLAYISEVLQRTIDERRSRGGEAEELKAATAEQIAQVAALRTALGELRTELWKQPS